MPEPLLIGVALAIVVLLGLVACIFLSKDKTQKVAAVAAFVSLILLDALFYVVIVVFGQGFLFPLFVATCLLLPIALYLLIMSSAVKKSRHRAGAKKNKQEDTSVGQSNWTYAKQTEAVPDKASASSAAFSSAYESESGAEFEPEVELELESKSSDFSKSLYGSETPSEPEPEQDLEQEYDIQSDYEVEPAFEPVFDSSSGSESDFEVHATKDLEQDAKDEAVSSDEPGKYEIFYGKAEVFAKKGMHAIAAQLYVECLFLTNDLAKMQKATFAAMNAYIKAGLKEDAKQMALTLRDGENLGPAQAAKLAAILKML